MPTLSNISNTMLRQRGAAPQPAPTQAAPSGGAPLYGDIGSMMNSDLLEQWKMMSPEARAQSWYSFAPGEGRMVEGKEGGQVMEEGPWQFSYDKSKMPEQWQGLNPTFDPSSKLMHYDQSFLDALPKTKFSKGGESIGGGYDQSKTLYNSIASLGGDASGPDPNAYTGAEGHGGLKNKDLKYYDPAYGWITPQENTYNVDPKENGIFGAMNKYGMPAALTLASMFGGPQFALGAGLFGGAKSAISGGDWKDILMSVGPSLLGAGIGGMGNLGGWGTALNLGKTGYGIYNAIQKRDPIGGAMSLARLSGLGG